MLDAITIKGREKAMSTDGKCATAAAGWLATWLARPFKPVFQTLLQRGLLLDGQSRLLPLVCG